MPIPTPGSNAFSLWLDYNPAPGTENKVDVIMAPADRPAARSLDAHARAAAASSSTPRNRFHTPRSVSEWMGSTASSRASPSAQSGSIRIDNNNAARPERNTTMLYEIRADRDVTSKGPEGSGTRRRTVKLPGGPMTLTLGAQPDLPQRRRPPAGDRRRRAPPHQGRHRRELRPRHHRDRPQGRARPGGDGRRP